MKRLSLSAIVATLALASSCRIQGKQQPFTVMDGNGEVLRAAFNADVGKVRIVALVAPT